MHQIRALNELAIGILILTLVGLSVHDKTVPFVEYGMHEAPGSVAFSPHYSYSWSDHYSGGGYPIFEHTEIDCDKHTLDHCKDANNNWWIAIVSAFAVSFVAISSGVVKLLHAMQTKNEGTEKKMMYVSDLVISIGMLVALISGIICLVEHNEFVDRELQSMNVDSDSDNRYFQPTYYYFLFATIIAPSIYVLDMTMYRLGCDKAIAHLANFNAMGEI